MLPRPGYNNYDVIIIGAGPAGIFTALSLADMGVENVILLEKGNDVNQRDAGDPKSRLCGWGGAGAYSDGKLTLSTEVGGFLGEFLDKEHLNDLLIATDGIYSRHGAPDRLFGDFTPRLEDLANRARASDLEFIPARIRHIGTDNCRQILERFREVLDDKIDVRTGKRVQELFAEKGKIKGVKLSDGSMISGRFVVAAPGRSGAGWMKSEAESLI